MKSTRSQLFKTIPDIEIWPRFDGEIEENPDPTEWIDLNFTVADEDVGEELLELLRIDKFADTLERALLYTRGSLKATEKLEQNDS